MTRKKMIWCLTVLIGVSAGLILAGCGQGGSAPLSPEDESATRVAQQVAEAEAVAATLTAKAVSEQLGTPAPVDTSTPIPSTSIPTVTSPPTNTPETVVESTATDPLAAPLCTVVSNGLNIRSGPGLAFETLLTVGQGTELTPIAFNGAGTPGGRWVEIQDVSGGQDGWVSAEPQFITCTINPATLPFAQGPPPPTATATNTPVPVQPTPTPTPPNFFAVVPGGGPNRQLQGFVQFPGYGPNELDENDIVVGDRLTFRVVTYDASTGRTDDGAGIGRVEFRIEGDEGEVYRNSEETRAYCLFGGDDPLCPPWVFSQHGYTWPDGAPVDPDTYYYAEVIIRPLGRENDDDAAAIWDFNFRIAGVPSPDQTELQAEIVQTGWGYNSDVVNDALIFQVRAYNPAVGNQDGNGIENVSLRILRNGQQLYERTERNVKYCAFSGGDNGGDCQVWIFADHNYEWPGGQAIQPGTYTLEAEVRASNGQRRTIRRDIQIEP